MKKLLLLASVVSFLSVNAEVTSTILQGKRAQEKAKNGELVRIKNFTNIPNYVKFKKGKELPSSNLENWLKNYYETDANYGLQLIDEQVGSLGMMHYRYIQTINGVPIESSMFLTHTNNGLIHSLNGYLFSNVSVSTKPSLGSTAALNAALSHVGATLYKWQDPEEEHFLKHRTEDPNATYYPTAELVLINKGGKIDAELVLAYKFNIYAEEPHGRTEVFVDAHTGGIVWEQNLIHEVDVTGTATTLYSGNRTITCDNTGGNNHRLQETGRGNGIRTFTNSNTTNYNNTDITNNSNNWAGPEAGLDAHFGSEMTYDYYLTEHGRNSIDGNGFRLDSYVHHDNNYANAFWNGQYMTYGDGSGNNAPLTSLDIAGHEITHGLTSNSANLVYQNESGALNESFSDIFGNTIERWTRPSQYSWTLGEDLSWVIRDMSNPKAEGDPDTYMGTNYYTGTQDNGGVHTNSGVQNYWYYLLCDGGSGTNDNNDNYNISSLGVPNASKVAFRNLTVYLTQNDEYVDARFYGIQSAIDLFGPCSFEHEQVTNAWYAVGVGLPYSASVVSDFSTGSLSGCAVPFSVNFNNNSINGVNYTWDFGDGSPLDTNNNPTHNYMANGTYTVELIADGGLCGADTTSKTAYITVSTPNAPVTTDDNICENNTANLLASGSGVLNWYNNPTGGTSFFTGPSYTTPVLSNTTTYYVDNVVAGASGNLGKLDNTGGGNNFNNFQYLIFDVFQPMELVSVEVYSSAAGNRTIELRDDQGNPLQTKVVNLTNSPTTAQTVNLNFMISPGTDYQLGVSSTSNIDLYRNNAGTNYPYTLSGIASITRSSAGTNPNGYYYFFYDWNVKEADCVSPRQPVTANVSVCTGLEELNSSNSVTAYYDASGNIQLGLNDLELGIYNMNITNSIGQVVAVEQINVASSKQIEEVNLSNNASGVYMVNIYNQANNYTVKLVK